MREAAVTLGLVRILGAFAWLMPLLVPRGRVGVRYPTWTLGFRHAVAGADIGIEVLMTTLMELQRAIEAGMRRGKSFSAVEDEIIESSRLSDEAKSALWLYGWSFVDAGAQRREACAHIAQLAAGGVR